jgi:parallel beta-helix repeat protein
MALDENVTAGESGHIAAHAALKAEYVAADATPAIADYTATSTAAQHATIHNALHTRHNTLGAAPVLPVGLAGTSSGFLAYESALDTAYNARQAEPTPLAFLYVAKTGSDSNPGTLASPKRTIQAGLNASAAGTAVRVRAGTYNESLVLPASGTATARRYLMGYNGEVVTVNSGLEFAVTSVGAVSYWTIDGIRFLSVFARADRYPMGSVNFADSNQQHNYNIIRNCYIEGVIQVVGHHNLVENCEMNGLNDWEDGYWELFKLSHHNTVRGCHVHNFVDRGLWSMKETDSVTFENNIVHHIGWPPDPTWYNNRPIGTVEGIPINIDGGDIGPTNAIVRGNLVYDTMRGGILNEDGVGSLIENNTVIGCPNQAINVTDYARRPTTLSNVTIRNNVVVDSLDGIHLDIGGGKVYNNTLVNSAEAGIRIGKVNWRGSTYCTREIEIADNIITGSNGIYWASSDCSPSVNSIFMHNNLYSGGTWTHAWGGSRRTLAQTQALGFEKGSLSASPLFVNAANRDYHLQTGSPAKNAGVTLPGVTADKDGAARIAPPSIGAYE